MYKYIKRILDIIFSILFIIILFIPMLIISILILIEDRKFFIFKQKRTGKNGKEFNILKFRSMEKNGKNTKNDKVTKIGRYIRKTSFDELPQLFNILKGDMSFVGPRPWIPDYYKNMNKEQRRRVSVPQGLTGLAQVNGRNGISVFEKIDYDLKYVDSFSFKQDISIIFKTISIVFKKDNIDISNEEIDKEIEELKRQK